MIDTCIVDLDTAACDEYASRMRELNRLIETIPPMTSLESRVAQINAGMKGTNNVGSVQPHTNNVVDTDDVELKDARQALQTAISEAELATEQHGIKSNVAQVAWETVEEIASAIGHHLEKQTNSQEQS
jgi:CP12 domain